MKKKLLTLLGLVGLFTAQAQYRLSYESFSIGGSDTTKTVVLQVDNRIKIESGDPPVGKPVPGIALHYTYIDYALDTIISQLYYSETEQYYCGYPIAARDFTLEGTEKINGYNCTKYSIVLFSNRIDLWVTQDLKIRATAAAGFAELPGVLVRYCRNGNAITQLSACKRDKTIKNLFPSQFGVEKDSRELDQLEKEKLVLTYPIFHEEKICYYPSIPKPTTFPYDSVLHFANGTVILKRVNMELLPEHYQIFAELEEYSNGDAYDRTGSIFIIPTGTPQSLLQALIDSIGVLPYFTDKESNVYQGMTRTDRYQPPVELVRFFTPFGVRHYNQYRALSDKPWAESVYYKQDITDFRTLLDGEVYIGAFIGNYDKNGHKLSLVIKAYPGEEEWTFEEEETTFVESLFNTCNVMEMAGQNYGQFFGTDSLTVTFDIPEGTHHLKLRYTSTGHGGWGGGDEFNPKANTLLIDGEVRFIYTPWRCDCGTYRTSNPASGNFWNGISSSDYSRSGWCPGTATQPTFFDLSDLTPGRHTLTIAIPQGESEGGSFSAWCVSGVLIGTKK